MATFKVEDFTLPDGFKLSTKTWEPEGATKAAIVHLHGFSDHYDRYVDLFPELAKSGILCWVADQRGWGHSVSKPVERGDTGGTTQVMSDITALLKSRLPSKVPLFLMGHSMGGGQCLYYAANGPPEVVKELHGFIALSPWIALDQKTQPWGITVAIGRLVSKIMPRYQIVNKLDPFFLAHDEAACLNWAADPLCHDTGTLQTMAGCLTRAEELNTGEAKPQDGVKSIMLAHGSEDKVTSHEASKNYMDRINHPDKTYRSFPGAYHCIFAEPDFKASLAEDIAGFVLKRSHANESQSKL